jgi:hypothetical protein
MAKLQGSADVEAAADVTRNVADTNGVAVTAGNLFGVANNAALKFAVGFLGEPVLANVGALAAAGSSVADGGAIVNAVSVVSAADGTKGVVLPAAKAGRTFLVYNSHASNGLKVYAPSGGDINDGSADAAVTIEGKTLAIFVALDTSTYAAIFTANT